VVYFTVKGISILTHSDTLQEVGHDNDFQKTIYGAVKQYGWWQLC